MDIIDDFAAETDDFIARGHAIITRNLGTAERLAQEYPAVAALLPAIRSTLQELFDHLVSVPTLPHEHAHVGDVPPAAAAPPALSLSAGPDAPLEAVAAIDLGPLIGEAHPATDALIDTTAAVS